MGIKVCCLTHDFSCINQKVLLFSLPHSGMQYIAIQIVWLLPPHANLRLVLLQTLSVLKGRRGPARGRFDTRRGCREGGKEFVSSTATFKHVPIPRSVVSTSSYRPSMITMALSCIISEIKRDFGRKSRFFHTSPAFNTPVIGVPVGILR